MSLIVRLTHIYLDAVVMFTKTCNTDRQPLLESMSREASMMKSPSDGSPSMKFDRKNQHLEKHLYLDSLIEILISF